MRRTEVGRDGILICLAGGEMLRRKMREKEKQSKNKCDSLTTPCEKRMQHGMRQKSSLGYLL